MFLLFRSFYFQTKTWWRRFSRSLALHVLKLVHRLEQVRLDRALVSEEPIGRRLIGHSCHPWRSSVRTSATFGESGPVRLKILLKGRDRAKHLCLPILSFVFRLSGLRLFHASERVPDYVREPFDLVL